MAKISPFRALRYDKKIVPISKVVCPPYDVITQKQRRHYIRNSPYNIVRVVLPGGKDKGGNYSKAQRYLYDWTKNGILKQDDRPSVYIYKQQYKIGKRSITRLGFLSLLKLEDKGKKAPLPHEKVFSGPFLDRARLMKKIKAHPCPIFIIFSDPKSDILKLILNEVKCRQPEADINFEGVRNILWKIDEQGFIKKLTALIKNTKTFIADGHHRFAASMAVKNYFMRLHKGKYENAGWAYTLSYFVSSKDKGLLILPTHRAVKVLPDGFSTEYLLDKLKGYFDVRFITAYKAQQELCDRAKDKNCAFVFLYKNKYILAVLKDNEIIKDIGPRKTSYDWKRLNVSILHNLVFAKLLKIKEKVNSHHNVYYYKDRKDVIERIKSNECQLGVFLSPARMEEVEKIAQAGEKMPHKSTYFYPKPLTGLVIHRF